MLPLSIDTATASESFYVDDVAFRSGLVPEQTPLQMAVAAALGGFVPPDVARPFSYCDLGCGDGSTAIAVAATNPLADVVGIDFNPLHIAAGNEQIARLGLTNVRLFEASFAALEPLSSEFEQPFDLVACNGIYSWLEDQPRQDLITFLQRHLRPGGLFYVETTTLPGMAAVPPLWHLIQTLVPAAGRSSRQRAEEGLDWLERLSRRGMAFISSNPRAAAAARHYLKRADRDRDATLDHFIHNAMASGFKPRYSTDVMSELASAGLRFAGRSCLPLNDIETAVPPSQVPTLRDEADPGRRQLLMDFIRNEQNRRDVYIKDLSPDPEGSWQFLCNKLALLGRSEPEKIERAVVVEGGTHKIPLRGPLVEHLLSSFESQPRTLAQVLDEFTAPIDIETPSELVRRTVARLIASGQFFLCLPHRTVESSSLPAHPRFTFPHAGLVVARAEEDREAVHLTSSLTGGAAIRLAPLEVLLLQEACRSGFAGALESVQCLLATLPPGTLGSVSNPSPSDCEEVMLHLRGRKGQNLVRLGLLGSRD